MNHSERIAKAVIETILVGAQMQYRRDQSKGQHDFDLQYTTGIIAAVEVTASVDETMEQTIAAISNERRGDFFVSAERCQNDWLVHPLSGANINRIRNQVDKYLAAIEAEGRRQFFVYTDVDTSPGVARIWSDLQIESGKIVKWKDSPCIGIDYPAQGGPVSVEDIQRAIEAEANKEDNRRKLAAAGTDERHLFVYVDSYSLPWTALVNGNLPEQAPYLPDEITHVLAATQTRSPDEYVVWRAERAKRWQDLGRVSFALGASAGDSI